MPLEFNEAEKLVYDKITSLGPPPNLLVFGNRARLFRDQKPAFVYALLRQTSFTIPNEVIGQEAHQWTLADRFYLGAKYVCTQRAENAPIPEFDESLASQHYELGVSLSTILIVAREVLVDDGGLVANEEPRFIARLSSTLGQAISLSKKIEIKLEPGNLVEFISNELEVPIGSMPRIIHEAFKNHL